MYMVILKYIYIFIKHTHIYIYDLYIMKCDILCVYMHMEDLVETSFLKVTRLYTL